MSGEAALAHTHSGTELSHEKGRVWVSSKEAGEPGAYGTDWSESERER